MKDKLEQLKEEYCKWHCEYRNNSIINVEIDENGEYDDFEVCDNCEERVYYTYYIDKEVSISPCEFCKVSGFISYIRDNLGC